MKKKTKADGKGRRSDARGEDEINPDAAKFRKTVREEREFLLINNT